MTETAAQQEQVRRYRRAARHRRDEAWEDVVYLHDEIGMSPTRIMRRLHIPYFVVLAILEEHYAGRWAAADAARIAELPERRRGTVRVEALVHASIAGMGPARDRRAA